MILELLDEAVAAGARLSKACEVVGISVRCVERWRVDEGGADKRAGPLTPPSHKLSAAERQAVLDVANSREFREPNAPPRACAPA